MNLLTTKKLNNGTEIPYVGLGVFQSKSGGETANAVKWALQAGYRHIDTAAIYGNEEDVGKGIRESGVPREEIFLTTKLWNENMRQGTQMQGFEESLSRMAVDYVDLYLIHWPVPGKFLESWKVMEEIYASGRARAVGVSNFDIHHLDELLANSNLVPAVNQIECHPRLAQTQLRAHCEGLGIAIQAWSPLGGTGGNLMETPELLALAKKHNKTPAQIILRWDLQQNMITIPKSVHQDRIVANTNLFDFTLSDTDMESIARLNQNKRIGPDPDNFDF